MRVVLPTTSDDEGSVGGGGGGGLITVAADRRGGWKERGGWRLGAEFLGKRGVGGWRVVWGCRGWRKKCVG